MTEHGTESKPLARKTRMQEALQQAFAPEFLEVIDESDRHAGHQPHFGGAGHEGETHFRIKIVSAAFVGRNRVARHRLINDILAPEIAAGLHALALEAKAPGE